tara:strand:- start:439 stop:780 length:342 start_codon:yes stop_codon:yes gene_type:complete
VKYSFFESIEKWNDDSFDSTFNREINKIPLEDLQLIKAIKHGNYIHELPLETIILNKKKEYKTLYIKSGIFFNSITSGCNCSDNFNTNNILNEYCELLFKLEENGDVVEISLI